MWRKTRSFRAGSCVGVDANRNYDFHWQEVGSSANSCAQTYHGPKAFSEVESQINRDIMKRLSGDCKFFLTLHSYGNYLLYVSIDSLVSRLSRQNPIPFQPWGYSNDLPENWRDQEEVAQAGAQAMKQATGTEYTVGSTSNTLYLASGESLNSIVVARAANLSFLTRRQQHRLRSFRSQNTRLDCYGAGRRRLARIRSSRK